MTAVGNFAEMGTAFLLTLVSVALTLPYLGRDRFGAWMTIVSFTALLSFLRSRSR